MLASPVPVYLGCAGLIVGSLGLGAQHMLSSGSSVSAIEAASERPLFARSVEQASLPSNAWPSQMSPAQNSGVAHYDPMLELLTTPARPAQQDAPSQSVQHAQEEPRAAPREVVRDIPQQQTTQPRRSRSQGRNETRGRDGVAPEQVEPRDASAQEQPRARERQRAGTDQERQRAAAESERREQGSRRSSRRYQEREDAEPVDPRARPERRRVEQDERRPRARDQRVVIREDVREREPEPRGRGPDYRGGPGFNPLAIFGAFERY